MAATLAIVAGACLAQQPSVRAAVARNQEIRIGGRLDEPAWANATAVTLTVKCSIADRIRAFCGYLGVQRRRTKRAFSQHIDDAAARDGVALAVILFVTAMPAAAVCCLGKTSMPMASMHAAMPCCAENCTRPFRPSSSS